MQYNETKDKVYKIWNLTNLSDEDILRIKKEQDRLKEKYDNHPNYQQGYKKGAIYLGEWQLMDSIAYGSAPSYWKYATSFTINLYNFPISQIPYINIGLLFKSEQAFIDNFIASTSPVNINMAVVSHEKERKDLIIADSYNLSLVAGIELNNSFDVGIYRQLWAKMVVTIKNGKSVS